MIVLVSGPALEEVAAIAFTERDVTRLSEAVDLSLAHQIDEGPVAHRVRSRAMARHDDQTEHRDGANPRHP